MLTEKRQTSIYRLLLTGKDEGNKTEQEATQPKHKTREDYLRNERFIGQSLLSDVPSSGVVNSRRK